MNSLNNSKIAEYYLMFARMLFDIRFKVKYFNHHIFALSTIRLKLQRFMNLEAGPCFADIWYVDKLRHF